MKYGASEHYQTAKGEEYFAYQQGFSQGAVLEAAKFAPHVAPTDKVLDFGCGGGWVLGRLTCADRVGVELNAAAHPFCRENGVRVHARLEDIAGETFDVAISNHCLEHVPCPVEALRGIRALLKPRGKIVVVVPIDDWRAQRDFTGRDIDHHLHTWTPRLMANTLSEAGFEVETVEILTHAWFPGWQRGLRLLPRPLFDGLCFLMAVAAKRRQLLAVARTSS